VATRRQFLQGSLATTGLAFAGSAFGPGRPVPEGSGMRLPLQGMVFEHAEPRGVEFAAAARRIGLEIFGIGDDITPVWLQLESLWRATPVAIGGLTTSTPLLLLEQSGRDHGLRIVFRAEHRAIAGGAVNHTLRGPRAVLRAFGAAAERGGDFSACAAQAMVRCPMDPAGGIATISLRTPAATGRAGDRALYSWVLAPRRPRTLGAHA
jgi:hypothetical protein